MKKTDYLQSIFLLIIVLVIVRLIGFSLLYIRLHFVGSALLLNSPFTELMSVESLFGTLVTVSIGTALFVLLLSISSVDSSFRRKGRFAGWIFFLVALAAFISLVFDYAFIPVFGGDFIGEIRYFDIGFALEVILLPVGIVVVGFNQISKAIKILYSCSFVLVFIGYIFPVYSDFLLFFLNGNGLNPLFAEFSTRSIDFQISGYSLFLITLLLSYYRIRTNPLYNSGANQPDLVGDKTMTVIEGEK